MGTPDSLSNLREDQIGEVFILRLRGRLDAASSPQVEHKIFEAINSGQTKMLIEMGGVIYLSSAGLRMLFSTTKKLRSLSGKLVVCNMATNVSDVLKMSGFDHVLDLAKNEEEALKHF